LLLAGVHFVLLGCW
jgi:hypothetical protein